MKIKNQKYHNLGFIFQVVSILEYSLIYFYIASSFDIFPNYLYA
jgi:hypothetical protein